MARPQVELNVKRIALSQETLREGMDVVIVSANSQQQADYWLDRLQHTRGQIAKESALICTVYENWEGGAGNGLGTLYAYQRARHQLLETHGVDLESLLIEGRSIGLYHTAGKGTRLAPLPGSEYNNKAAVKLPGYVRVRGTPVPITILESVIRQTSAYAASRPGRLSVFWGDQIFVPSESFDYTPRHHVDILASIREVPNAENWEKQKLHKYGLIAVGEDGEASQVEKVSYEEAMLFQHSGALSFANGCGISLGCFSLSAPVLRALVMEFFPELRQRKVLMNTDEHFWMPMTLDWDTFLSVMQERSKDQETLRAHYERMQEFKLRLLHDHPGMGLLGAVDIGKDALWWDYGQIPLYIENNRKLLGSDDESRYMRYFFGVPPRSTWDGAVDADGSVGLNCRIGSGRIRNSVLVGVHAEHIQVEDAVIIDTVAPSIEANRSLIYNATDNERIYARPNTVRADVFIDPPRRHLKMYTDMNRDASSSWSQRISGNPMTFEELYDLNTHVDMERANLFAVRAKGRALHQDPGST
ncbi:MAG: hypothetical protein KDK78_02480 [Chlamydiia bacterium]|nr:hypothetical protein [Chlamydiia bacterium]